MFRANHCRRWGHEDSETPSSCKGGSRRQHSGAARALSVWPAPSMALSRQPLRQNRLRESVRTRGAALLWARGNTFLTDDSAVLIGTKRHVYENHDRCDVGGPRTVVHDAATGGPPCV